MQTIIDKLYDIVLDRKKNPPQRSYVVHLLNEGIDKIGAKIIEEANEFIEAADENDEAHTIYEAADLLFHYIVLLGYKGIEPDKVFNELERRFGVSGITEKESRGKKKND